MQTPPTQISMQAGRRKQLSAALKQNMARRKEAAAQPKAATPDEARDA
jgi:hypothetical protein